ncbi:exosortase A system-associated hydrolase 2 [Nitrosospira multiformis]|uniref:Exosortase A system-associated hydrolase 2 n=1 Tax=Nitrosospira multiformis TaxID=1231 RepID=A0A1H8MF99_9PROT|nr:hydrolase 2, exosortase A system-associated [Nitrosospira multiformis]SEO15960.1 exosortase A system-associated hydrolase 2 [Nitrosospira multiformis]
MKTDPGSIHAEPFFLQTDLGQRFCLFHKPHSDKECRGTILYIHPFGEEMNKSRRMAALQARAFAAAGFGVLQVDLYGCGDSSGDFSDAGWTIWKQDLALARCWLENRISVPVSLWGLRLGALLALDFARSETNLIDRMILWQPVVNGQSFLNQFLRLKMANEMLADPSTEKATGTNSMRQRLANGETLEVAGYELASDLALTIDSLKAIDLAVRKCIIHWFEIVSEPSRPISPAAARVVGEWKRKGVEVDVRLIACSPFWATQEISECPGLITATTDAFTIAT